MIRDQLINKEYFFNNFMHYSFVDKRVEKVAKFVVERIYRYFDDLKIEFEWVEELYYDCIHVNTDCTKFYEDIMRIKQQQQAVMLNYFSKLYVDMDIDWCEQHINELFEFLSKIQPKLKELYDKILNLYIV